jgi:hypothetical protein
LPGRCRRFRRRSKFSGLSFISGND